ncbi:MAG: hypothetical protein FWB76_03650 [Oscillospiraceae bacterium]|nr:hypothetical protein [Oscillospiraceae bacterium]
MINLFRRTTILFNGLILFASLVSVTLGVTIEVVRPWLAVLIWIVLFLVSATIAGRYAEKLNKEIDDIYAQKCDPHAYIEKLKEILETRRIVEKERTYVLLNICAGHLANGDTYNAKLVLDRHFEFSKGNAGLLYKATYYNHLCACHLRMDDIANAETALNHMLEVVKDEKFPKQHYDGDYNSCAEKQFLINIAKGNYSGAEEWFLIKFNREKSLLGKVAAQYRLGQIYLHFERFEEAEKAFNYVIEHGNTTYYVAKSRELLHQCTAKEE